MKGFWNGDRYPTDFETMDRLPPVKDESAAGSELKWAEIVELIERAKLLKAPF